MVKMPNRFCLLVVTVLALQGLFGCAGLSPANDYDIRSMGAVGDGVTFDTAVIQRAIDVCSAQGGGRVTLSHGRFLTGTLTLKSGVELHLAPSATLLGSPNCADYVESPDLKHVKPKGCARGRATCLIYADEAENIAITGRGTIDCNGQAFVRERPNMSEYCAKFCRYERIPGLLTPPRVVFFAGCRNVTVTDVTVVNQPAGWCFWVNDSDLVFFDRVKILGGMQCPNNDGIHVNCCRDVMVSNCVIETQDDSIVVRADYGMLKEPKTCERVNIVNCSLRSFCSCIRISFLNDGELRSCLFSNLTMHDSQQGIRIELRPKRGQERRDGIPGRLSTVEDLSFENIDMQRVGCPVTCTLGDAPEVNIAGIRNIRFTNVFARGARNLEFVGGKGNPLSDFTFLNCAFETEKPVSFVNCQGFRYGEGTFRLN